MGVWVGVCITVLNMLTEEALETVCVCGWVWVGWVCGAHTHTHVYVCTSHPGDSSSATTLQQQLDDIDLDIDDMEESALNPAKSKSKNGACVRDCRA